MKGGLPMGTITATGAMLMITGWVALVEFDSFPEAKRNQMIQRIKKSPASILLIALMPVGILINMLGSFFDSFLMVVLGASLIFLQGIIVSFLFWKRKRWKSILLFSAVVILGIFMYIPLFIL